MNPRARNAALLALAFSLPAACAAPRREHLPAPGALGPYSAAVTAGDLVFVSGKTGKTGGTWTADVEAALDSIEKDLARLDLSLADAVSVTVYLTDISAFAEMNAAYARRFPQPYPARTTVAVQALPGGARVEIQVVAARRR